MLDANYRRWIDIIRYRNRILSIPESRWPCIIYQWDKSLEVDAWAKQCEFILNSANMDGYSSGDTFNVEISVDLSELQCKLSNLCKNNWWLETLDKPKLRTYRKIQDLENPCILIKANLPRNHRSYLVKLKCGVLPLALETGRFNAVPIEERICHVCETGLVEDEEHFLMTCTKLQDVREIYWEKFKETVEGWDDLSNIDKLICMYKEPCLKLTGKFIEELWKERKACIYE